MCVCLCLGVDVGAESGGAIAAGVVGCVGGLSCSMVVRVLTKALHALTAVLTTGGTSFLTSLEDAYLSSYNSLAMSLSSAVPDI